MSAPSTNPTARARASQRLADLLSDHGPTEIGRWIGHAKDTAGRRGSDLNNWPSLDLFALADRDPALRAALVELLTGSDNARGEAIKAQAALFHTLQASSAVVAEASRDLSDGRIDSDEAKRLLPLVRDLRDQLANEVLPALEAYHG
jgi:hypothetical protein